MTDFVNEDDAIAVTAGLTRERLGAFIAAEVIVPLHATSGLVFRRIDIARLGLLCELSDDLDLDEHALAIVMSLIDQLHEVRLALRTTSLALADSSGEIVSRSHPAQSLKDK